MHITVRGDWVTEHAIMNMLSIHMYGNDLTAEQPQVSLVCPVSDLPLIIQPLASSSHPFTSMITCFMTRTLEDIVK